MKPHSSKTNSAEDEAGPSTNSGKTTSTGDSRRSSSNGSKKGKRPKAGGLLNLRQWEKEAVLDSLEKHCEGKWLDNGTPDKILCEKISKDVADLTPDVVSKYIERNIRILQQHRNSTNKPIDKWYEVMDAVSPEDDVLEKQLGLVMMVAREEPSDGVPKPAAFDSSMPQPDYESIYEYLSCAFTDKPLPILSPIDSLVVEDCMQSLTYQIECLNDEELRKSLRKVYLHLSQKVGDELEPEDEDMKKNMRHNATFFNPLGLNAQAIVPVVPD